MSDLKPGEAEDLIDLMILAYEPMNKKPRVSTCTVCDQWLDAEEKLETLMGILEGVKIKTDDHLMDGSKYLLTTRSEFQKIYEILKSLSRSHLPK